jgi:hypothetical protein
LTGFSSANDGIVAKSAAAKVEKQTFRNGPKPFTAEEPFLDERDFIISSNTTYPIGMTDIPPFSLYDITNR